MSGSDRIVVNSYFTKDVVESVFPSLATREIAVVWPCVVVDAPKAMDQPPAVGKPPWPTKKLLLSINRFERKKDVGLAIRAYAQIPKSLRRTARLVLAGGYDPRNAENMSYHNELVALADSFGLLNATAKTVPTALAIPDTIEVLFLLSVPNAFKETLLSNAKLLVYTPKNEHFGIVPVEAMKYGVPVLASNTGGPLETIIEKETGWLRDVDKPERWTGIMEKVLGGLDEAKLKDMGKCGRKRVWCHFTRGSMSRDLDSQITGMIREERHEFVEWRDILLVIGVCGAVLAAFLGVAIKAMGPRQFGVKPGLKPRDARVEDA